MSSTCGPGIDRLLDPNTTRSQGFASFSPDGRYLAFEVADGRRHWVWLEPVDGSSPARQVGRHIQMRDTGT